MPPASDTFPLNSANPDDLAISRHHFAQYVLASKVPYNGPSLKELKAIPNVPPIETLAIVDWQDKGAERGSIKKTSSFLLRSKAAEYRQEVLTRYNCIDDSMTGVDAEDLIQVDYLNALNELYNDARPMKRFQHDMDDAFASTLKMRETRVRRQRDAQFPQSIEEFHSIPDRDTQLRIARFLMRSTSEQEKMMDDYGWAWRAVNPLLSAFKTNDGFKNEILESVKDVRASDPRRRPTATPGWQS
ncbi:hypothetical protein EDB19DRAFT_2042084 [Suillus lakei]|nr:hypothetical protein EDB19DRAFT_2042084 [Suillus lakei]